MLNNKKKGYKKPTIEKVKIDKDITMVMLSDGFGGGSDDAGLDLFFGKLSPLKWIR